MVFSEFVMADTKKARLLSGLFVSITTSGHRGSDTLHTDRLHPSSAGLLFW